MSKWDLYEAYLYGGADVHTSRDQNIISARESFLNGVESNPGYRKDALRNNVEQPLLVTATTSEFVCEIAAMPGDDLEAGDIIECFDEHWLVVGVRLTSPIQKSGVMWLCNQKFVFQNFNAAVVERYGVMDDGSYSKSKTNELVPIVSGNYNIYLPLDEDTRQIYVDKRLATGTQYNALGESILEVYVVKNINNKGRNTGSLNKLLVLGAERDVHNKETDNVTLLICNYVAPVTPVTPATNTTYHISGRARLRIGTTNPYQITLINSPGSTIPVPQPVDYEVSITSSDDVSSLTTVLENNIFTVSCPLKYDLIGKSFNINLTCAEDATRNTSIEVEVVTIG